MKNPLKTESSAGLGLLLARLPIGAFFLMAGYAKVSAGVEKFVNANLDNVPKSMPPWFGPDYLHALPWAEIAVGVLLMTGLLTRLSGLIASLMLLSFMIGAGAYKQPGLPFHPNFIYLGVTLLLFLAGPGKMSLDAAFFQPKKKGPPHP